MGKAREELLVVVGNRVRHISSLTIEELNERIFGIKNDPPEIDEKNLSNNFSRNLPWDMRNDCFSWYEDREGIHYEGTTVPAYKRRCSAKKYRDDKPLQVRAKPRKKETPEREGFVEYSYQAGDSAPSAEIRISAVGVEQVLLEEKKERS